MLLGAASLNAAPASGVTAFVKDHHLTSYSVALIDMNGDNRPIVDDPSRHYQEACNAMEGQTDG